MSADSKPVCVSCKKRITNDLGAVTFKCPACGKATIVRCSGCRKNAAKYVCHECGFSGPN